VDSTLVLPSLVESGRPLVTLLTRPLDGGATQQSEAPDGALVTTGKEPT
jgi:hypothetical protein